MLLSAGLLLASLPARADFLRQNSFVNGSELVSVSGPSATASAGGFSGVFGPSSSVNSPLLSYCIELVQYFRFGEGYSSYTRVPAASAPNTIPGGMGPDKAEAISRMFGDGRFAESFTSRERSVAMQLAVWEIVYETAGNAYDLATGTFRLTSSEAATITSQAATYLSFTGTGAHAQIAALTSVAGSLLGQQDFITVVPVPPSAALMATGLMLGLWTLRRRRDGRHA